MTRPYVTKVKSPLKLGVDVELGQRTVLVGRNGVGKTSVVQAIQLATNNFVNDTEGRDKISSSAAIARLFPSREGGTMFVELDWSDGETTSWNMKPTKAGFKKPTRTGRTDISFPFADLKAALVKNDASVKEWIDKNVSIKLSESDIMKAVQAGEKPLLKSLIATTRSHEFFTLAKAASDQASSLRREATVKEATVERMAQDLRPPLTDEEVARMQVRMAELEQLLAGTVSAAESARQKERLDAKRANLVAAKESLAAMQVTAHEDVDTARLAKLRSALDLVIKHTHAFGTEKCVVCGTKDIDLVARRETLTGAIRPLVEASSLQGKTTILDIEEATVRWEASRDSYNRDLVAWREQAVAEDADVQEHQEGTARLRENQSLHTLWHNYKTEKMNIEQGREKAAKLTKLASHLNEYGAHQLKARKSELEERVSQRLPKNTFAIDFDAALLGFKRGDSIHTALSGAEWSEMLMAISAATAEEGTPIVLSPDDRAWDEVTLSTVMVALADVDAQILIMSTVLPDEIEGWTVLQLG